MVILLFLFFGSLVASKLDCTIMLITVNKIETSITVAELGKAFSAPKMLTINGYVYNHFGYVKSGDGYITLCHTISEQGSDSPQGSLQTAERVIRDIAPLSIIQIGIGYGIDRIKNEIGHVYVAERIIPTDHYKISSDGKKILRGGEPRVSGKLLKYFKNHAYINYDGYVKFCKFVSAQQLVDNNKHKQELLDNVNEICLGEMEGKGLATACDEHDIPWIMIKSPSDYGDGLKKTNETMNQIVATTNVVVFLIHALKISEYPFKSAMKLDFIREIEHFHQYTTLLGDFSIGVQIYSTNPDDTAALRIMSKNIKHGVNINHQLFVLNHDEVNVHTESSWYALYIRLNENLCMVHTSLNGIVFESSVRQIMAHMVCNDMTTVHPVNIFGTNVSWARKLLPYDASIYTPISSDAPCARTIVMFIRPLQCKTYVKFETL